MIKEKKGTSLLTSKPTNGNGHNGYKGETQYQTDAKKYKALQKAVGNHIQIIDALLEDYYGGNPHFPRAGTPFFKWTILREKKSTVVDVFFRENRLPKENGEYKKMLSAKMMKASAKSLTLAEPGIYTYDETGAPPSGPKEPKGPGQ